MKLALFVYYSIVGFIVYACAAPVIVSKGEPCRGASTASDCLSKQTHLQLFPRSFGALSKTDRGEAHAYLSDKGTREKIQTAATASVMTKTYGQSKSNKFHLDRQQPTNARGDHRVALELGTGSKDHHRPSTIAQVVIHKDAVFNTKSVVARLKHSLNTGKEERVHQTKKASNIAQNVAKHSRKQQRVADNRSKGNQRAASGHYKKGRK